MGVGMHAILMPFTKEHQRSDEKKNIKIFHDHIY